MPRQKVDDRQPFETQVTPATYVAQSKFTPCGQLIIAKVKSMKHVPFSKRPKAKFVYKHPTQRRQRAIDSATRFIWKERSWIK